MKSIILVLCMVLTLFACTKSANSIATPTNDLFTTWKLVKYQPGFGPTGNYNGEIQWTFTANDTVAVSIQTGVNVSSSLPLRLSGNYTYRSTTSTNQITLEGNTYKYTIANGILTIEDLVGQAADGKKLTFNSIQ